MLWQSTRSTRALGAARPVTARSPCVIKCMRGICRCAARTSTPRTAISTAPVSSSAWRARPGGRTWSTSSRPRARHTGAGAWPRRCRGRRPTRTDSARTSPPITRSSSTTPWRWATSASPPFMPAAIRTTSSSPADIAQTCEYHIRFFGEPPPMERYVFLVMAVGNGYGGLEHRASTSLLCNRDALPRADQQEVNEKYRTFLGLCSHEYFHTWNVNRIAPAAFVAPDLSGGGGAARGGAGE